MIPMKIGLETEELKFLWYLTKIDNMKTIYLLRLLLFFTFFSTLEAQEVDAASNEAIIAYLNKEIAPNVEFKAHKDKVILSLAGKDLYLDLYRKTPDQYIKSPLEKRKGRYIGPIFWLFDFPEISKTSSVFESDSLGQIQLRILLKASDTILIKSRLNAFSSVHHTYNSAPHRVAWTGKKSLKIQLAATTIAGQRHFSLQRIKLEGTFNRTDRFRLSPRYIGALEKRFTEALNKLFLEQKNTALFSIKTLNKN